MIVFWKYDLYPFVLAGTLTNKPAPSGMGDIVHVKEYDGFFKPIVILPDEVGIPLKEKLETLRNEYHDEQAALLERYMHKKGAIFPYPT